MIHPSTELRLINEDIGYGVVATELIPKGTITWALDKLDRTFTPAQISAMEPVYQSLLDKYCYRDNKGRFVLCWDHGRFVNHSFKSNCLCTAYNFELAVRDIYPGEELTDDYGYLNLTAPFRARDEGTRRKQAYPDDLLRHHSAWDRKLKSAIRQLPGVKQPLRKLLAVEVWDKSVRIAHGETAMDSILNIYYPEQGVPVDEVAPAARAVSGRDLSGSELPVRGC